MSSEALQIAEKRRETKCKRDRESYRKFNADFQRIARRDKRAFLNEQCKDIVENKRKGTTRDLFRKIGAIKGTFRVKMDMIKGKNDRDLTEAEDIKKRWQEYTESKASSPREVGSQQQHSHSVSHPMPVGWQMMAASPKAGMLASVFLLNSKSFSAQHANHNTVS